MKNAFKISLLALALLSTHAFAAEQRLDGKYFDIVYEDSELGLFGTPMLSDDGNTVFFSPATFSAKSTKNEWSVANSTISFWIEADSGHHLAGTSVIEQGDYSLRGKKAEAFVLGETRAVDVRFDKSVDVDLVGADELPATGKKLTNWEAKSLQTFQSGATKIRFTIENVLFASAGAKSGYAFIEKKYVGLTVSAVPEPESYAMMLAGLGLMGTIARRRSKAKAV